MALKHKKNLKWTKIGYAGNVPLDHLHYEQIKEIRIASKEH